MAIAEREVLSPPAPPRLWTEAEYLAREEAAEEKSEFIEGRIVPMSGGTDAHAAIPMNLGAALVVALRGRGCLIMSSDIKVWAAGSFYYPDLTVACGPMEYRGRGRVAITNPILVVEVLSPSTAAKDRGEKFQHYQQIESLQSYLLVSQDEARVEQFSRGENGHWDYTAVVRLEGILDIPALSVKLALSDIYDQIDFTDTAQGRGD